MTEGFLTLFKVAVVFVAVIAVMRKRLLPHGVALAAGGVAVALLMVRTPAWIAGQLAGGLDGILFSAHTVEFVAVMGMIVALTTVLEKAGQIDRLTTAFRTCFRSPRLTLATLPAIIGLLPMPGGALFSAPMVASSAKGTAMGPEEKALVNYWYRHVWEYAWPLYPGVIFAAQLMDREVRTVSLAQSPLCVAAIAAGLFFLSGVTLPEGTDEGRPRRRSALDVFVVLLPFILVFVLYLAARLDLVLSCGIGLGFACLWHLAARNIGPGALLRAVFANRGVLGMLFLGYGAKVFGEFMIRTDAIDSIAALFQSMHLPVLILSVVLPLAVGFFAGMTIVYVLTTFPILLAFPAVAADPIPYLTLAYTAGFCGTLLSPIHSCLVLSTRYFESDLLRPIRRMLVPCAIVLATGVVLLLVYRELGL